MGKVAFVYAGQGAQHAGMGQSLYETSPAARAVLDQAESLRPGTLRQCFEGDAETLSQTRNTQPCLMAVDAAVMVVDSAKGIEAQTKKLFEVVKHRNIPVFTFINKLIIKLLYLFINKIMNMFLNCILHDGFHSYLIMIHRAY